LPKFEFNFTSHGDDGGSGGILRMTDILIVGKEGQRAQAEKPSENRLNAIQARQVQ
jgi:hypothetical protein